MSEHIKLGLDFTSYLVVFATLADYLPEAAALFSIIWTGMRIYDWIEKRVEKWRSRRIPSKD